MQPTCWAKYPLHRDVSRRQKFPPLGRHVHTKYTKQKTQTDIASDLKIQLILHYIYVVGKTDKLIALAYLSITPKSFRKKGRSYLVPTHSVPKPLVCLLPNYWWSPNKSNAIFEIFVFFLKICREVFSMFYRLRVDSSGSWQNVETKLVGTKCVGTK